MFLGRVLIIVGYRLLRLLMIRGTQVVEVVVRMVVLRTGGVPLKSHRGVGQARRHVGQLRG
jgi:hypothetical protein